MSSQALSLVYEELDEESEAIQQAKLDMTFFEPLYRKYHDRIFRFIAARMENLDDAGDICSASFLKAMQNLGRYQDRGVPFGAWLYRIALNEVNQFYRRRNAQRIVTVDIEGVRDLYDNDEPVQKEQALHELESAIQGLPTHDIELIRLKYFERRPYEEIAELLGQTVTNLKVRVHRIKARIRTTVQQNK